MEVIRTKTRILNIRTASKVVEVVVMEALQGTLGSHTLKLVALTGAWPHLCKGLLLRRTRNLGCREVQP